MPSESPFVLVDDSHDNSSDLVLSDPTLTALQRRHMLMFQVAPASSLPLCAIALRFFPPGLPELVAFGSMWLLTALGVSIGLHRLFSHRAYSTGRLLTALLAILGMMAAQGPLIYWVGNHRRHHQYSDRNGDPHSPHLTGRGAIGTLRGFWHAQMGWLVQHPYPNPRRYAPDLIADPLLLTLNRRYFIWPTLGLLLPGLACALAYGSAVGFANGVLWGGLLRMFVVQQGTSLVNSACHLWGSRRYALSDHSRNIAWLAIPTVGESWHNNHHAFPRSAQFGHRWWQLDPGWYVVLLLEQLRLAADVRRPRRESLAIRATAVEEE